MPDTSAETGTAPKGRNLNSLALERQVPRSPKGPIRPEGAEPNLPATQTQKASPLRGGTRLGCGPADLALKRQAIQIPPILGGLPG